jgi:very-short-patch-repair endonuclease
MLVRRKSLAGFKFRRQHPFGPYVLDFYCARARLAIELDGGQHGADAEQRYDRRRSAFISERGVHELRFKNIEVLLDTEAVLNTIWLALHQGQEPSPPTPSRKRAGGPTGAPEDLG